MKFMLAFSVVLFLAIFNFDISDGKPFNLEDDQPEVYTVDQTTMGDHGSGMDHSMKMYYHSSAHSTILFQGWHTMNWWELFLSCLAVAVFAALYEGLKFLREWLMVKQTKQRVSVVETEKNGRQMSMDLKPQETTLPMLSFAHIVQCLLHFGQMFAGYSLMMVFMTFNIYLCIFLCIGGAVGYFFFGPRKIFKGISECCD